MVEVLEVSSRDNVRKSTLVTSVPLSAGSHLSWVGFSVTAGTCMDSVYIPNYMRYKYRTQSSLILTSYTLFSVLQAPR